MKKTLILLVCLIALKNVVLSDRNKNENKNRDTEWNNFKKNLSLKLNTTEEKIRKKNFDNNYDFIANFTRRNNRSNYKQKLNEFALYSYDEIKKNIFKPINLTVEATFYRYKRPRINKTTTTTVRTTTTTVKTTTTTTNTTKPISTTTTTSASTTNSINSLNFSWLNRNIVNVIENQMRCGSCYAFASAAVVESAISIKRNALTPLLSKQQIVECTKQINGYTNFGCNGGYVSQTMQYVIDFGLQTQSSYPYVATDTSACKQNSALATYKISNYFAIENDPIAMKNAIVNYGPITVYVSASMQDFMYYSSGIYDNANCASFQIDHAVVIVGYGTDSATGLDYWLVRNSWGTSWGENGYMRITRGKNTCNIESYAVYVTV